MSTGEYIRGTADFYAAIEHAGFERKRDKSGRYVKGLRLKSMRVQCEFLENYFKEYKEIEQHQEELFYKRKIYCI